MRVARIALLPLLPDPPGETLLRWLAGELRVRLDASVEVQPPLEAAPSWQEDDGAQLSSGAIVDSLIERFPQEPEEQPQWILAVSSSDLTGGGRDFVFGEATLGGAWAVVSTARLGAAGTAEFRPRLLREALHELGHLAGLRHCADSRCLMAAAADVNAIDRRGMDPCSACFTPGHGT